MIVNTFARQEGDFKVCKGDNVVLALIRPLSHAVTASLLEKSLFLAFEIESNIMICSLKPFSVQFVKNFHLGFKNSV